MNDAFIFSTNESSGTCISKCTETKENVVFPTKYKNTKVNSIGTSFPIGYEGIFIDSSAVKSITVPEGFSEIQQYAFASCRNLNSISLPSTLKFIKHHAFYDCSSLKEITIPASTCLIQSLAFAKCSSLEKIVVDENNYAHYSSKGVLYVKNDNFLQCYPNGRINESFIIPDDTRGIIEYAFAGSKHLKQVYIPNTITNIPPFAFLSCEKLKDVVLSNGIKLIGMNAFSDCGELSSIVIPDSVTSISYTAFLNTAPFFQIRCNPGSYAEKWAKNHGYATRPIMSKMKSILNSTSPVKSQEKITINCDIL